jgi:redox-sensitive bicupin YhaK (pirin superfamily)
MSRRDGIETENTINNQSERELIIVPRTVDIGGFEVHRALPTRERRLVGPFIFWDQMGPGRFAAGHGVDVRPHPHIGLSTVTYLFDGSLDHKDSLGNDVRILPGDVNLMHAGRGIVHSERTGPDVRKKPSRLFGIQSWLAQPRNLEESTPFFSHTDAGAIPKIEEAGLSGRVILGQYQGCRSPIEIQWEAIYLELNLRAGASLPVPASIEERAIFPVSGRISINKAACVPHHMIVLRPGIEMCIEAAEDAHFIILGGAAMDGPRYIWWNFVSSSVERIKDAAQSWKQGEFALVPGDAEEFIPLPEIPYPDPQS